jgi:hypothetical protein
VEQQSVGGGSAVADRRSFRGVEKCQHLTNPGHSGETTRGI